MRSPLAPLLALIALGLLVYAAATGYPPSIEADIEARAAAALAEAGLDGVAVSADGRDVRLTGRLPSELDRARATRTAGNTAGVRRIYNDIVVGSSGTGTAAAAPAAESAPAEGGTAPGAQRPWQTRFRATPREVVLEGDVPDAAFRQRMAGIVTSRYEGRAILDSLAVRAHPAGQSAGAVLETALAALAEFVEGEAVLTDTGLQLTGTLRPGVDAGTVEAALRDGMPEGYRLDFQAVQALDEPPATADPESAPVDEAAQPAREAGESACQRELDELLADGGIVFASGSTEVDARARGLLDRLAGVLSDCPGRNLEVAAHTDSTGSAEVNQRVSEARALAVTRHLEGAGVPADRLTAVGYGESRPVADNSTPEGRRQNRRIEFRLTGQTGDDTDDLPAD